MLLTSLIASGAILSGCGSNNNSASGDTNSNPPVTAQVFNATVARTSYGIPHIQAADFKGLGYGIAYAYAQDNVCMFADSLLTVRGERSKFFGPTAFATQSVNGQYGAASEFISLNNQDSDFFYKGYLDIDQLNAGYAAASQDARDLVSGYVTGYNRYLREHANSLPDACKNAAWVRPMSVQDMYLVIAEKIIHASGEAFANAIVAGARDATTPSAVVAAAKRPVSARVARANREAQLAMLNPSYVKDRLASLSGGRLGSNGLALGKDVTASGSGILLGNPHFPWTSTDRFYQMHLTVPGRYDVMGASLAGLPVVMIGFNKDVAWTHTVSTANHFTTYQIAIDPSDTTGTSYLYDGKSVKMTAKTVTIDVLQANGSTAKKSKTFYFTQQGPVLVAADAGINWTSSSAVVLADANRNNTRLLDQWLGMGKAGSVTALKQSLDTTVGLPWVNTIAADRTGNTLFADASVVPNMPTTQFLGSCLLVPQFLMFDGTTSNCAWAQDKNTPPGIFSPANAPYLYRTDYVGNSNDSYWLANPKALLDGPAPYGYSPLYGSPGVAQSLRTRIGFTQVAEGLAANKRFQVSDVQDMLFNNRVYAAELLMPDILKACATSSDATILQACSVLQSWDMRANLNSRGEVLFREFWNLASNIPNLYAVPFDPANPVTTPKGLATGATAQVLQALKAATQELQGLNVPLNGQLGDFQDVTRNGIRISMHGGNGDVEGTYNAINMAGALTSTGYHEAERGVSYVQVVSFNNAGPVAQTIMSYSQSTDPKSQHYSDQTSMYGKKQWVSLPFDSASIHADPAYSTMNIGE